MDCGSETMVKPSQGFFCCCGNKVKPIVCHDDASVLHLILFVCFFPSYFFSQIVLLFLGGRTQNWNKIYSKYLEDAVNAFVTFFTKTCLIFTLVCYSCTICEKISNLFWKCLVTLKFDILNQCLCFVICT